MLGAAFGAYSVVLAIASMEVHQETWSIWLAILAYIVAVTLSLWPGWKGRMPLWLAFGNLAVSIGITLVISSQLDPAADNGHATWYVGGVGLIAVTTLTRGRPLIAYLTVAALTLMSLAWGGLPSLLEIGVVGSVAFVVVGQIAAIGMTRAGRDVRQYARAQRQSAEWEAEQEARLNERIVRLARTSQTVAPTLRMIVERNGDLRFAERRECMIMEAALRDEIRGRGLLNDDVRAAIAGLRRRGATVSLLDEGYMADVPLEEQERILTEIAEAVTLARTDRLVIRSLPPESDVAVTVVGVSTADAGAIVLGQESQGERVDLWLEIPRVLGVRNAH
jgi:hypothetical protein